HVVVLIERIAYFQLFVGIDHRIFDLVVNLFVNNQTPGRCAPLAGGSHGTENSPDDRVFDVGIWGNDDGVVAAQFEQGFSQTCSYILTDGTTHANRAGG